MFLALDEAVQQARSTRSYDPFGRLSLALTPISKAGVNPYKGNENSWLARARASA